MDEYEDLDQYNGDAAHDMNVDYDYHMNTAELSDYFDDDSDEEYAESDDEV